MNAVPTFDETYGLLKKFQENFNQRCDHVNDDAMIGVENASIMNCMLIAVQRMIEHQQATAHIKSQYAKDVVNALSQFTYLEPEWK